MFQTLSQVVDYNKAIVCSVQVESPKIAIIIDEPPVSIRPIDTCDPWSLQNNKEVTEHLRCILTLMIRQISYRSYTKVLSNVDICLLHFRLANQELFWLWKTTPEFSTRMVCLRIQLAVTGQRRLTISPTLLETSCGCLRYVLFKIFAIVSILPFEIMHTVPLFIEQEAKSYSHILICCPPGKFHMEMRYCINCSSKLLISLLSCLMIRNRWWTLLWLQ